MNRPPSRQPATAIRGPNQHGQLHPDVLRLGLVSSLTDLSAKMIFSVFAVFFTTVAGASSALLGLIEGLADFSASSLNYLAGWLSAGSSGIAQTDLVPGRFVERRASSSAT